MSAVNINQRTFGSTRIRGQRDARGQVIAPLTLPASYEFGDDRFNLSNTATFGRPTNRASQVFGSGGPRAFQIGGGLTF